MAHLVPTCQNNLKNDRGDRVGGGYMIVLDSELNSEVNFKKMNEAVITRCPSSVPFFLPA